MKIERIKLSDLTFKNKNLSLSKYKIVVAKANPKNPLIEEIEGMDKKLAVKRVCPTCKIVIKNVTLFAKNNPNYCSHCGQAFIWEEFK